MSRASYGQLWPTVATLGWLLLAAGQPWLAAAWLGWLWLAGGWLAAASQDMAACSRICRSPDKKAQQGRCLLARRNTTVDGREVMLSSGGAIGAISDSSTGFSSGVASIQRTQGLGARPRRGQRVEVCPPTAVKRNGTEASHQIGSTARRGWRRL
jgi:hypothetical protein